MCHSLGVWSRNVPNWISNCPTVEQMKRKYKNFLPQRPAYKLQRQFPTHISSACHFPEVKHAFPHYTMNTYPNIVCELQKIPDWYLIGNNVSFLYLSLPSSASSSVSSFHRINTLISNVFRSKQVWQMNIIILFFNAIFYLEFQLKAIYLVNCCKYKLIITFKHEAINLTR